MNGRYDTRRDYGLFLDRWEEWFFYCHRLAEAPGERWWYVPDGSAMYEAC